jgi:hypothetical protein
MLMSSQVLFRLLNQLKTTVRVLVQFEMIDRRKRLVLVQVQMVL